MQETPASVPRTTGTQQAGEPNPRQARRLRWCWSEASIWTDRMLAALETGVKRDVWFSLIDKVYSLKNPWSSWSKTARNNGAAGMDGMTTDRYEKEVEANLVYLSEPLKAGTFQPRPIRRTHPQARRHAASVGGYRRFVTASFKARSATSSNRSLRKSLPGTATAFVPVRDAKTHCGGWMNCSRADIDTWWTRT